jgi:hypothetical protein
MGTIADRICRVWDAGICDLMFLCVFVCGAYERTV